MVIKQWMSGYTSCSDQLHVRWCQRTNPTMTIKYPDKTMKFRHVPLLSRFQEPAQGPASGPGGCLVSTCMLLFFSTVLCENAVYFHFATAFTTSIRIVTAWFVTSDCLEHFCQGRQALVVSSGAQRTHVCVYIYMHMYMYTYTYTYMYTYMYMYMYMYIDRIDSNHQHYIMYIYSDVYIFIIVIYIYCIYIVHVCVIHM